MYESEHYSADSVSFTKLPLTVPCGGRIPVVLYAIFGVIPATPATSESYTSKEPPTSLPVIIDFKPHKREA